MLQNLLVKELFKQPQKKIEILLEIKQLIKLLHWANKTKNKESRRNLHSARKKTTNNG